jgi:hypothetical protein
MAGSIGNARGARPADERGVRVNDLNRSMPRLIAFLGLGDLLRKLGREKSNVCGRAQSQAAIAIWLRQT